MHPDRAAPHVFEIEPAAIYDEASARLILGLSERALAPARRRGQLQSTRIGRRRFYRGAWLLGWLGGEADEASRAVDGGKSPGGSR
jgi:hypothetical protein